jgi:nitrite reductase/ring-hydroxylating ferredoxin subunit
MFRKTPRVLAHRAAIESGLFVAAEYIIGKSSQDTAYLLNRYCPHRSYPLGGTVGSCYDKDHRITCDLHGMSWTALGSPINNDCSLLQRDVTIRNDGLIIENLVEDAQEWSKDLQKETALQYHNTVTGKSAGSWLWAMEIQADLLHIGAGKIHPALAESVDLSSIQLSHGQDWISQKHNTGWWTFIYPYTFLEWSAGCLSINYVTPDDPNNEFGFTWNTQFYFDPAVSHAKRSEFRSLEEVFCEDVGAIEQQKGPWFPLKHAQHSLEQHCVHWGKWVQANKAP